MPDGVLTESTLLNLFRGQRKHRKQFNNYFDDDIRHYRSRRNRRIDLQTLQEIPQTLEQVEQCIVTRRNPTGSLECSYVTRELIEGRIRETYIKKCINPSKQRACWWEGNLKASRQKIQRDMRRLDAHQASRFAKDPRECLEYLHRRAKTVYQFPVAIAIFFERFRPSLEQFENSLRRIGLFERGGKRVL